MRDGGWGATYTRTRTPTTPERESERERGRERGREGGREREREKRENPDDPNAEARFKAISEAYQVSVSATLWEFENRVQGYLAHKKLPQP